MHFEGRMIVDRRGPMPWVLRAILALLGLGLVFGPFLIFGQAILHPEAPMIGLLIGAGALIVFAIAGMLVLRQAFAPRHDLRFDPASRRVTVTTHGLRRSETVQHPLRALSPPQVERIRRSDSSDDYALHIRLPGQAPITIWYIESEEEAELWCRRIEAMRLAAQ